MAICILIRKSQQANSDIARKMSTLQGSYLSLTVAGELATVASDSPKTHSDIARKMSTLQGRYVSLTIASELASNHPTNLRSHDSTQSQINSQVRKH
jgi:hypothetical protein